MKPKREYFSGSQFPGHPRRRTFPKPSKTGGPHAQHKNQSLQEIRGKKGKKIIRRRQVIRQGKGDKTTISIGTMGKKTLKNAIQKPLQIQGKRGGRKLGKGDQRV